MKKCSWCGKRTTNDSQKREGMCVKCYTLYKKIGKNLDKYA